MAKILYLHSSNAQNMLDKQKVLETTFGNEHVLSPDLKTRNTATLFTLSIATIVAGAITFSTYTFIHGPLPISIGVLIFLVILLSLLYLLGGRGATHIMLKRSKIIAEKAFKTFQPNIIVAYSFGAVTAFQLDVPKCPMLLFSPAQDQYKKYMKVENDFTIKDYPYVLIVHGCSDTKVPLEDSIRLIESGYIGKCRLEVIDDDDKLESLNSEDIKIWVDEVFEKGKKEVIMMSQEGNKQVDASLYKETA